MPQLTKIDPDSNGGLFIVGLISVLGPFPIMILPILVAAYVDYLGFGSDVAGWISAAHVAGIAVMTLIVSLNTKHWALEKVAGYGFLTMIAFDLASLVWQVLPAFPMLRFGSGLGAGAVGSAGLAAIARARHPDKGYGVFTVISFVLPGAALFGFAAMLPYFGYNGLMVVIIVLQSIGLLISPFLKRYPLVGHRAGSHNVSGDLELAVMMKTPALLSILAFLLYGAANGCVWAYADRIGLSAGLDREDTGNVLAAITTLSAVSASLVIWLRDKIGHLRPLVAGVACQVTAMLILIQFVSPVGYTVGIGLFSLAWAVAWPYFVSIQADIDATGTVVVGGQFANTIGTSAGPALAAFFVGSSYVPAVLIALGLFFACLPPIMACTHLRLKPA